MSDDYFTIKIHETNWYMKELKKLTNLLHILKGQNKQ